MHVVVAAALSLISCVCAQEQVRMTLLSIYHYQSEYTNGQYQCYLSDPDRTGTTVTSYRAVDTRNNGDAYNPDPPPPVYEPRNPIPYYRVLLYGNGNDEWFGVFGCEATRSGKIETRISTTRMRSDADFAPANELFTQTVNVGDRDVSITMYSPAGRDTNGIRWRKDNSDYISSQSGSATYVIPGPIQLSDAGTYECQYQGERDMAKQGLNLLLVRACSASRWGPPNCTGVCDSCYNGGICDENSGNCVCPPGFMGDNCLQACGGNRFGHTCEIRCSSSGAEDRCRTYLFCLVHPFGCRCNTGWRGLDCNTACDASTFGASCLQSCHHCASNQCDRYTGRCLGSDISCKPGWIGDNCQECDGNYFRTDCSQDCHCTKENCNRESGLCKPGSCLPQWIDLYPPYSCQTGLQTIKYTKMNPEIPVPVICQAVEGPGGDLSSLELVLSKDSEHLEDDDITTGDRSQDGTTGSFTVTNVQTGDMLHCQLRDGSGKLAVMSLSVELFDLPVLSSAPVIDSVDGSSVTIRWLAWDETTDIGDPPLVGYMPYYKVTEENDWTPNEMVSPQTLVYTFTSLNPETYYSFSVSAVRAGEGGEGPRSPEAFVRNNCDVPPNPEHVMAEISGEKQELVKVSWQLPSEEIICSSGVINITIYYSSSEADLTSVDVADPTTTSVILFGLTPGVAYTFYVTISTSGGESEMSNEVVHLVPVLPSLSNPPTLPDITCSSVTMVWSKWTEEKDKGTPPITHYIPYYRINVSMEWISGDKVDHSSGDEEYSITFHNLIENKSYEFCVTAVREGYGGEGDKKNIAKGETNICKASDGVEPYVVAVAVIVPIVMILIVIAVVFLYSRFRGKSPPKTTPQKPVEAKYENEGYSTISKDHVKSQSTEYQGLKAKESIMMLAKEHPTDTDDAGYEIPIPVSSRGNIQDSNGTRGRTGQNVGKAEKHYDDPDISRV